MSMFRIITETAEDLARRFRSLEDRHENLQNKLSRWSGLPPKQKSAEEGERLDEELKEIRGEMVSIQKQLNDIFEQKAKDKGTSATLIRMEYEKKYDIELMKNWNCYGGIIRHYTSKHREKAWVDAKRKGYK